MERFILRFEGNGNKPLEDLARIRASPNLTVLDDSSQMLLVEAPQESVTKLAATLPQWRVTKERFVPIPDTRLKVRGS